MKNSKPRVMVDMSATLLHHGHIRLLKNASEYGTVIVALTTDEEIKNKKGYTPELKYEHRKEVLEAIKYVDHVVPSPWLLDQDFINLHKIDFLVHGEDNSNMIDPRQLLLFPRTAGVSSSDIRSKAAEIALVG